MIEKLCTPTALLNQYKSILLKESTQVSRGPLVAITHQAPLSVFKLDFQLSSTYVLLTRFASQLAGLEGQLAALAEVVVGAFRSTARVYSRLYPGFVYCMHLHMLLYCIHALSHMSSISVGDARCQV